MSDKITEDELRELYYEEKLPLQQVAEELGVGVGDVAEAMMEFGLERRADMEEDRPWRDEERLREMYVENNMSMAAVADELGCTPMTIQHWLEKFDLKEEGINQPPNRDQEGSYEWRDEEKMREMYEERGMSITEMAEEMDCAYSTISKWFDKHGIERYEWRDEEKMRELYVEKGMSVEEIARELDCAPSTVEKWLDEHGIEREQKGEV